MTRYATPRALEAALGDRLKLTAKLTGRSLPELRRQVARERLLARLFDPASPTADRLIVKGGTGLLMRVPGTRYTRDVDLQHQGDDVPEAIAEIRTALERPIDLFRFQLSGQPRPLIGHRGVQLAVEMYLGVKRWEQLPIDLVVGLDAPIGRVDVLTVDPVAAIDDLAPPTGVRVYPISAQTADKVCAMYADYHGRPSTRYHDLIDLVVLAQHCDIPPEPTRIALQAEARRRALTLPAAMTVPGPGWPAGYAAAARTVQLQGVAPTIGAALAIVGQQLNPLLATIRR